MNLYFSELWETPRPTVLLTCIGTSAVIRSCFVAKYQAQIVQQLMSSGFFKKKRDRNINADFPVHFPVLNSAICHYSNFCYICHDLKNNLLTIEKIPALKNHQSVKRRFLFAVSFSASLVSLCHLDVYHLLLFLSIMPPPFAEIPTLAARKIFFSTPWDFRVIILFELETISAASTFWLKE